MNLREINKKVYSMAQNGHLNLHDRVNYFVKLEI